VIFELISVPPVVDSVSSVGAGRGGRLSTPIVADQAVNGMSLGCMRSSADIDALTGSEEAGDNIEGMLY